MHAGHKKTIDTLERGNIYFFYRPRVEEHDPEGLDDIERMYMVLSPQQKKRYRLALIGRKKLPEPSHKGKGRAWGFIDSVRKDPASIRSMLEEESYSTKTRGNRTRPAARPIGEGVYRIVRHEGHTHLIYALELPERLGQAQQEFEIQQEASFVISVANPERSSPPAAGLSEGQRTTFPKHLKELFRDRKFADVDPPEFLDHEGAEFLLVSAAGDIKGELGVTMQTDKERPSTADLFKELRLDRQKNPVEPLFTGELV
jgi:hypothetical protein